MEFLNLSKRIRAPSESLDTSSNARTARHRVHGRSALAGRER
jgi:hypothetical protein